MLDTLETYARRAAGRLPASTRHWAVRGVHERSERLSVRDDVTEAPSRAIDDGVMVTVVLRRLVGLTPDDRGGISIKAAGERRTRWPHRHCGGSRPYTRSRARSEVNRRTCGASNAAPGPGRC
jgi:hypothetical protein